MTATVHDFPGSFAAECPNCLTRAWGLVKRKGPHHVVFRCKACETLLEHKTIPGEIPPPAAATPLPPPPPKRAV